MYTNRRTEMKRIVGRYVCEQHAEWVQQEVVVRGLLHCCLDIEHVLGA